METRILLPSTAGYFGKSSARDQVAADTRGDQPASMAPPASPQSKPLTGPEAAPTILIPAMTTGNGANNNAKQTV
jgi:hypothetical protein